MTLAVLVVLGAIVGWYKCMFPYGDRSFTLRHMSAVLDSYAADHFGKFPDSADGAYDALRKLYPDYCLGPELAGVSGEVEALKSALDQGKPIDASLTSWVYVPGFEQTDDSRLAILWESREGLYANGKRNFSGGRAVLLLDGGVTNVPAKAWKAFLNNQEELQKSARARRNSTSDAQPKKEGGI